MTLRVPFFLTAPGLEFPEAGSVVTNRRAGLTALGVKIFTRRVENPGLGLENPGLGYVTPKAGLEKKEGGLGCSPLPFAVANVSISRQTAKSAISHFNISDNHHRLPVLGEDGCLC